MRRIPVDAAALGPLRYVSTAEKTDFETGAQKRDKEGRGKFVLSVLIHLPGGVKPELFEVSVAAWTAPTFGLMEELTFANLSALPWDTNGKSGVAFIADDVTGAVSSSTSTSTSTYDYGATAEADGKKAKASAAA